MKSTRLPACVAIALLAAPVPAQVPPGWFVVGTTTQGATPIPAWGNQPGLFLAHPRQVAPMIAVTGLPPSLVARPASYGYEFGVGGVAIHPATGDLLVGNTPAPGQALLLVRIRIQAAATTPPTFAATVVATITLGMSDPTNGGLVSQIAVRDANRVIVTCNDCSSGPIGSGAMQVGEVDLSTGLVTPWPAVGASFTGTYEGRAVCIDDSGTHAFFAGSPNSGTVCSVRKVPLPAAGAPTIVQALASGIPLQGFTMQWDLATRRLVLSGRQNAANGGSLWEIDPTTGATQQVGPGGPTNMPTFVIEPTTGEVLFVGLPATGIGGCHRFTRGTASVALLCNATAAGAIGPPFACALAPDPTPYGAASVVGAAPLVTWAAASTAGLPLVGNLNYSLRLDAGTGNVVIGGLAACAAGLNPGVPFPGLGVMLHVDTGSLLGYVPFASTTVPLPIPNVPAFAGWELFLQAWTLTDFPAATGVLGTTAGARLRIL